MTEGRNSEQRAVSIIIRAENLTGSHSKMKTCREYHEFAKKTRVQNLDPYHLLTYEHLPVRSSATRDPVHAIFARRLCRKLDLALHMNPSRLRALSHLQWLFACGTAIPTLARRVESTVSKSQSDRSPILHRVETARCFDFLHFLPH